VTPPAPPYFAVVFCSLRRSGEIPEYAAAAQRMLALAAEQPGFLGMDSARGPDGLGVSVSYWRDEASIAAWREHAEHVSVQRAGRQRWYEQYAIHIARVERSYRFTAG
jgi:heme-degrading monooxygenase HmoA